MAKLSQSIVQRTGQISTLIEANGLKCSASHYAANCQETGKRPVEYAGLVAKAKAAGVYLWMLDPVAYTCKDPARLRQLAEAFRANANALRALLEAASGDHHDQTEEALNLLAEAQSALKMAVELVGRVRDDHQNDTFLFVREIANQARIFVPRFLTSDDRAFPSNASDLLCRINDLRQKIAVNVERRKQQTALFSKLGQEVESVRQSSDAIGQVPGTISQLVGIGVPVSSPQFREILRPINGRLKEMVDLAKEVRSVVKALEGASEASCKRHRCLKQGSCTNNGKIAIYVGEKAGKRIQFIQRKFSVTGVERIHPADNLFDRWIDKNVGRPNVKLVIYCPDSLSRKRLNYLTQRCSQHGKKLIRLSA